MNNKRLYVDLHVLQNVPPSCVNRDDTGRPKTAVYGGATRARVSSQSWKHAIRGYFKEIFSADELGFRTKYGPRLVADKIKEKMPEISDEDAMKKAESVYAALGIKLTDSKDKKSKLTSALFFISAAQAEKLAELSVNGEKDKAEYKKALNSSPSLDIALFGRMAADDADLNVDAASQVAHSISTHAVQNEYDYFTAVDDCSKTEETGAGAGHLGTMEFNSATLYRYATVNVADLKGTIGGSTPDVVKGFAEAFIRSMPTGKQNSYANRTLPEFVYVTIREDQPVNLCGAFEKPVRSTDGYMEKSVEELQKYSDKVYADYCGKPVKSFVIGGNFGDAEKVNISELLEKLREYIANEVI